MTDTVTRLGAALSGHYRIERELGAGGMATVYLAHDLKHDRDVAIKVLHPDLGAALGAERFLSEIRTTARLQHPHILPLLDSGDADGLLYYVMPVVTGETLRAYLERVHQLPIPEVVRIASEVAGALDYAHRQNVVHRDIKPENILLHDGSAVVADFGIALAVQTAGGQRMTQTGLSLGTPQYMSPEQAMGERVIDARADVYALGAVTYEMLTGDAPFTGTTVQAVVAKVLTAVPERPSLTRKTIPPHVEGAVLTALAKLPADRFATAADFASALHNAQYTAAREVDDRVIRRSRGGGRALALVSAVAVIATAAAAWGWLRPAAALPVIRYSLQLPAAMVGIALVPGALPAPDASYLVFPGPNEPGHPGGQIWIKRRDSRSSAPIPGTADAQSFTLSPDGGWIAFVVGGRLAKLAVTGGAPVTLVPQDVNGAFGLAWLDDGTIVYVHASPRPWLEKVSANGGESSKVWQSDSASGVFPSAITGSRAILFDRCTNLSNCDLWVADLASNSAHAVLHGAVWARYAATGHVVYSLDGRLMVSQFDRGSLMLRGQPMSLSDSVAGGPYAFELSRSGTLVTRQAGNVRDDAFEMVWVDRSGRLTPVDTAWTFRVTANAANHGWALSPDGSRLAIGLNTDAGDDIWVKQLPRGSLSRVSYDPGPEYRPRWTRDGRSLTFLANRAEQGVYSRRADGLGKDSLLVAGVFDEAALTPDGAWVVLRGGANGSVRGGRDITGVRAGNAGTRVPLVVTPFDEEAIAISPDGRWLAYQSDETGRTEVFVRSFPNTNDFKHQVSNGGGTAPLWSHSGSELFFMSEGKDMMTARVSAGVPVSVGSPERLFHIPDELLQVEYQYYTPWDVAPDGRFMMARARRTAGMSGTTVVVAENWLTELKGRMKGQ